MFRLTWVLCGGFHPRRKWKLHRDKSRPPLHTRSAAPSPGKFTKKQGENPRNHRAKKYAPTWKPRKRKQRTTKSTLTSCDNIKYQNDISWVSQNTTLYYGVRCQKIDNMFRPFSIRPSGLTWWTKEEKIYNVT